MALRHLAEAMFENAGERGSVILSCLDVERNPYQGYDVSRHEIVDLRGAGILTPRSTAETTIAVAAEAAGTLWTAGAAVIEA